MNGKMIAAIVLIIIAILAWVFALSRKPAYRRYQEEERRLEMEAEENVYLELDYFNFG